MAYEGTKSVMVDNYVYFYHTGILVAVPEYADSIQDTMQINYTPSTVLARTAPIYAYSGSGPRTMQVNFNLHRDMMRDINDNTNANQYTSENLDIVDLFVREIQSAALPSFDSASKLLNPPIVAVRLGSDIFIKGVVTGSVGITYKWPIIPGRTSTGAVDSTKHHYSNIDVAFNIAEIDPYDAATVRRKGSFRGLTTTLEGVVTSAFTTKPSSTPTLSDVAKTGNTVTKKEEFKARQADRM